MSKTFCLDFGNTRQKLAVFNSGELEEVQVLHNPVGDLDALLKHHSPKHVIFSSVIDHDPQLETLISERASLHLLSKRSRLPFSLPVGKPETVGADRLAIAAAAIHLFPHKNTLAIGLGSCITYNFISQEHELLGGSISPGMEMRFRSMHEYTALLPLVEADWNVPLIGYDTKTNLQAGVILGMAKEIDGMIELYRDRYSNFNVLLTGGDIGLFQPHLKNKIFADPHLIFKGLYAICQLNHDE